MSAQDEIKESISTVLVAPTSDVFHFKYVDLLSSELLDEPLCNRRKQSQTRDDYTHMEVCEAIEEGYRPCGHCMRQVNFAHEADVKQCEFCKKINIGTEEPFATVVEKVPTREDKKVHVCKTCVQTLAKSCNITE